MLLILLAFLRPSLVSKRTPASSNKTRAGLAENRCESAPIVRRTHEGFHAKIRNLHLALSFDYYAVRAVSIDLVNVPSSLPRCVLMSA